MDKRKNCFQCKHFYITWDVKHPKGCKVYQVKSAELPWVIVAMSTKEGCVGFEAKDSKTAGKKDPLDLNRDDLW